MILRVSGDAVLLRAARMERDDLRTRRTENSVSSANGSTPWSHLL